ncbi:MAG: type II toxin-antitoxin system HicA family toxin [bacterium]|nr:type II toxin-antitoxin system HicA family toxin [bacterium]
MEKLLTTNGFVFIRQKGSHRVFLKGNITVVVPFRRRPLKKGTLFSILKDAGFRGV